MDADATKGPTAEMGALRSPSVRPTPARRGDSDGCGILGECALTFKARALKLGKTAEDDLGDLRRDQRGALVVHAASSAPKGPTAKKTGAFARRQRAQICFTGVAWPWAVPVGSSLW